MTEKPALACSLTPSDLEQRLAAIAELGAMSLIAHGSDGHRHILRFRSDPIIRARLKAIVAAEAQCCSFMDLSLSEEGGELVLSITAPESGRATAEGLAAAFAGELP